MSKDLVLKTPTLRRGSSFLSYRLCSGFRQVPRNSDMVKVRFTSFFVDYLRCLAFCNLAEKPEAGGMEGVPYRSTMNKKIDKAALAARILALEGISSEDKSALLELLSEQKRFGLVWEEKPEEAQKILRNHIPVLEEVAERRLLCEEKDAPNHILIEGDNLHALASLFYTHEGKFDAIYIDPPYNSGATDWRYNNDYVDRDDSYRHSKWLCMMEHRLKIAKRLLNPDNSVLIVTIDEKEYLHIGCLLEEMFYGARVQMVSVNIHPGGVARENAFARSDEYYFFVFIGACGPQTLELDSDWLSGIQTTSRDKVHWRALLRSGSNDSRDHSPGCFYPVFVSIDGKQIMSVGEALDLKTDKESIIPPEGQKAIFPIHANGSEGVWQCSPNVLKRNIEKGYVKLGGFTKNGMSINYLAKGEQDKVESGLYKIIGKAEDGSLILDDSNYKPRFIPTTQWYIKSHDALRNGTGLLNNILGPKAFSYPKSLYAVMDSLRFFVANNPNARILDFFAGSGTTMHAIMMLNEEDNGHRQCILVTNNENNICEDVTYERNKRVIQGYTNLKGQQVEGLKNNNLRYYKVDFVDREKTAANQKELMKASTDLLCIKENLYQEETGFEGLKLHPQIARYFTDGKEDGGQMLIIYEPNAIPVLVKRIEQMTVDKENKLKLYVMSEGQYPYTEDFEPVLSKVELRAMPHALYQAMRQVLPPPAEAENTEPEMEVSEEEADGSIYKSEEL